MSDTTSRALSMLNLLQTHRHWSGAELAARLGVTERTVRRDVDRLRELGYRIESIPGALGGYRLEGGSAVPPLLLTDEEAVAIAIGLRVAASQRLLNGAETNLTALAKVEQVLPAKLRSRVNALARAVQPSPSRQGTAVSSEVLGELALACRDHERVRFDYVSASGVQSERRVEPHTLVPADRHWYLLCWDLQREDWRTFRVDRLSDVFHTRLTFTPRELSEAEVSEFIQVARSWQRESVETDAVMELPLAQMKQHFGVWSQGATEESSTSTRWPVGGADFRETMSALTWIPEGVSYTTDLAEPYRSEMREILVRMIEALDAPPPAPAAGGTARAVRARGERVR